MKRVPLIVPFLFSMMCLVWGSSFILMKIATPVFGGMRVSGYRLLLGGLVLFPLALVRWKKGPISREQLWALLVVCMAGNAIPFTLQPFVIDHTQHSAFMGMVMVFVPLATLLWSIPILKTRPSRPELMGVIGGLVCLLVLMWDARALQLDLLDVCLALMVPFCYSYTATLAKRHLQGIDPIVASSCTLTVAGIAVLLAEIPLHAVLEPAPVFVLAGNGTAVVAIVVLGVVCTGLATAAFYVLLNKVSPLYISMVSYIIPFVAMAWGLRDGEQITLIQVVAMMFVFITVCVVQIPASRVSTQGTEQ